MDFEFSPEQEMLRDSVRRFLADRSSLSSARDGSVDPGVWAGLVALGADGLGMVDSAVVLEELGRAVCNVPLASQLAASVFGVSDGTLAVYEPGARYSWRTPATKVVGSGLHGAKAHVADVGSVASYCVTAVDGVFVTDAGIACTSRTVDGSRSFGTVTFDGAPAQQLDAGPDDVQRALDRLGVAFVVDGVGAAARALELAVEYAKERVQFDKPIGSFQAVQHLCADMLRMVELARAAAYYACWALDEADPAEAHRAAVMAQAYAASAFPQLGANAIQVFGGIGFTWEHDIHLYYKRLLSASTVTGTADDHLAELARITID
ncbi:MAG TPA: acyl-CoA dehydrogenase [Acidimicrobiia bacterium]|nr:acyl-CoA dehydrogenase [Acidimicrobiia bacterium]